MRAGTASIGSVRAGVVSRLRARQDELVQAIFARVQAGALAAAGDPDAEYLAGLRAAVVVAVEYGLEGIARGEEWAGPIPVAMVEQARRAACTGVSLEVVLRRYAVGHTLLAEFVVEEVDRGDLPGERRVLREMLQALASVLDRLLSAITREYGDELARVGRSPEQRRCERVRGLLDGRASDSSEFDYDFAGWHLGLIAGGRDAAPVVRGLAGEMGRRLLIVARGQERLWAWLGGREPFTAADVQWFPAAAEAGEGVVFVLGEPGRGIEGWRLTHRQAQAALLVALRWHRPPRVTRYADVALLAFALKDEALAGALVAAYLSPLKDSRDGGLSLRATLHAYIAAERNVSSAASVLGVARSTVESRLRTIEERLGRSLHACAAELEFALALDELGVPSAEAFES